MPRRALLIVNSKSRNGAAQLRAARERLEAHGHEPERCNGDCLRVADPSGNQIVLATDGARPV